MAYKWGFRPDEGAAFFQSYSRYDWYRAAAIAKELQGMGYPVWYDDGLTVGDREWREQISSHIKQSCAVIIYVTQELLTRDDTYVINEYLEAQERGKTVIIVFLDDININNISDKYSGYYIEWKRHQALLCAGKPSKETARLISNEIIKKKISFGNEDENKARQSKPAGEENRKTDSRGKTSRNGAGARNSTGSGYGPANRGMNLDPISAVYAAAEARSNVQTNEKTKSTVNVPKKAGKAKTVYPEKTASAGSSYVFSNESVDTLFYLILSEVLITFLLFWVYAFFTVNDYLLTEKYINVMWLAEFSTAGTLGMLLTSIFDFIILLRGEVKAVQPKGINWFVFTRRFSLAAMAWALASDIIYLCYYGIDGLCIVLFVFIIIQCIIQTATYLQYKKIRKGLMN